jgi:hypothetical protein
MKTTKTSLIQRQQCKPGSGGLKTALLIGLLVLATGSFAQNAIPAGTILPLQLNSSLSSKKSRPGEVVTARLMQDVPLPSGSKIHAGAKAVGHIVDVVAANDGSAAELSLQFDTLEVSKRKIPMTTNLRALASMTEVADAQLPDANFDRVTSESEWTTVQVGGDVVYRGDGPVTNGRYTVGTPVANGVLVRVAAKPNSKCHGDLTGADRPQALWVFSADACGTYGLGNLSIAHAGRSQPVGQITLVSESGNFGLRSGSGLLLRVQ